MGELVPCRGFLVGILLVMLLGSGAGSMLVPTSAQPAGAVITFVEDVSFSQLDLIENEYNWSSYGPGIASGDYDGDGDLDVYISASFSHVTIELSEIDSSLESGVYMQSDTGQDKLLRSDGDTDGDGFINFVDVTSAAGIAVDNSTSLSGAWGDYDGDGHLDLYISEYGHTVGEFPEGRANRLYHNDGDGTFSEVAAPSNVANPCHSSSAQWVDYDADGDLDLYSLNYGVFRYDLDISDPETNILYRNDGDLDGDGNVDFSDATLTSGLAGTPKVAPPGNHTCAKSGEQRVDLPSGTPSAPVSLGDHENGSGASWAATWFDHDGDGWQDVFIASDFGISPLYLNNGDGTFSAITNQSHMMLGGTGMGTDVGDLDGDGDNDLCQTNIGPNYIWERVSDTDYVESAADFGLSATSVYNVNWVCQFFDYDLDGDLDIFFSVGSIAPYTQVTSNNNLLFRNNGDGTFSDVAGPAGLLANTDGAHNEKTQGASIIDIDDDGDLDIIVGNSASPPRIYYNQATAQTSNHWIKFDLVAKDGQTALGAIVEIDAGDVHQSRINSGCVGSFGCDATSIHFGLGDAEVVDTVTIHWPSGENTTMHHVGADQELSIVEGVSHETSNPLLVVLSLLLLAGLFVLIRHRMES